MKLPVTKAALSRRARLGVEALEDRSVPAVFVAENFENPYALSAYRSSFHNIAAADIASAAAHDGTPGLGLVRHDDFGWITRGSPAAPVTARGQTISVWARFADTTDGRLYFGFGTRPESNVVPYEDTRSFRSLSLTLAGNTNQLLLQGVNGNSGTPSSGTAHVTLGAVGQTYTAGQWYRLEVQWGATGALTGRLYGSDGTTLLNTVTGSDGGVTTAGGVAFRSFGGRAFFDTVVVDTDSTGSVGARANAGGGLPGGFTPGVAPPSRANGPADGVSHIPWQYRDAIGTGRDIETRQYNQLQQFARVGNQVALSGANDSVNRGSVAVDWGPEFGGPASPILTQYIFRQRPGEATQLVGTPSGGKHFFSVAGSSLLTLRPGETDFYGAGLNATQSLLTPGSEIDPVTGVLHRDSNLRSANVDGINNVPVSRPVGPLDFRIIVSDAELDPAQNPAGTRWFMMGIAWVEGDTNVSNNSRWVEFTPVRNATTGNYTFTYPQGSGGQLDFRTIPGLVAPESRVTVLDNDQATFTGNWIPYTQSGYGYQDTSRYLDNGTAADTAAWSFGGLAAGRYRISVSYPADTYYGTVQTYTISAGGTVLGTVPINPQSGTFDFADLGIGWRNLGSGLYAVTGGALTVTLSGAGTGSVVADAVRIERVFDLPATPTTGQVKDDSGAPPDFQVYSGTWNPGYTETGRDYLGSVTWADPTSTPGTPTAVAYYLFNVTPGTYRVQVGFNGYGWAASNTPFEVWDGGSLLSTVRVDQRVTPTDGTEGTVGLKTLGTFTITTDQLWVGIRNDADSFVFADLVRIERL